jgi:hypothetical protein
MGFYIHRGREGSLTILEDLVSRAVYQAIVPTSYRGSKNENWYIRLLPPPIPGSTETRRLHNTIRRGAPRLRGLVGYFSADVACHGGLSTITSAT